jgi:hypothetical protein
MLEGWGAGGGLEHIRSDDLRHGHGVDDLQEVPAARVDWRHGQKKLRHTESSLCDTPTMASSPVPPRPSGEIGGDPSVGRELGTKVE